MRGHAFAEALNAAEGLDPVDPAYAQVLRIATALNLIPLAIGASVFDWLLIRHVEGPYGLITALAWLVAIVPLGRLATRYGDLGRSGKPRWPHLLVNGAVIAATTALAFLLSPAA